MRRPGMTGVGRRRTSRWYHDPFVRWTTGRFIDGASDGDGAKTRKAGAAGQCGAAEEGEMAKAYRPGEVEHASTRAG